MTTQRQRSYSTSASPRRSFSLPLRPPESLRATSEYSTISASCVDAGTHIQVLFAHPDSKIVNFTFSATTTLRGDPLPWSSPAERTIASGPLRIYKTVPHDVAFLQSGSALKPLLSRTQCWNVDGGQIFCLQLRPGNYWRIEILGGMESDVKCAEFRSALANIVAFEVTACPFNRSGSCPPVIEIPQALQPAKVWRRPSLRPIENAKNTRPQTAGGNDLHSKTSSVKRLFPDSADGIFGIGLAERVNVVDKVDRKLDRPISLRDLEGPPSGSPRASSSQSWREPLSFSETFQQRRARYGPPVASRRTSFAEGSSGPLQRQWALEYISRRGSLGTDVFTATCRQETAIDAVQEAPTSSENEAQTLSVECQDSAKGLSFFEDCGLEPKTQSTDKPKRCQSPPCFRTAIFSPTEPPLNTQIGTNDDDFAALSEYSSSPESGPWQEFTPPQSPVRGKGQRLGVSPSLAAPPVLAGATLDVSHHLTRQSTPENSLWYTPAQQPPYRSPRQRDGPIQATMELSAVVSVDAPEVSPVSTLSSSSEAESDYVQVVGTPAHVRPSPSPVLDAHPPQRQVRRVTSSVVLAKTANIAAATANFVVLKPSAFLVALMFSIATRLATRAVAGAAYSLAERGDLAGWDVWEDDGDDYGLAPPARSEKRRRKSEVVERQAWGLEERVSRKKTRK